MAPPPPKNTAGNPYWNGKSFHYELKAAGGGTGQYRARHGDGVLFARGERDSGMGNAKADDGTTIHLRNKAGDNSGNQPGSFSQFVAIYRRRNEMLAEGLARKAAEILERQVRTGSRSVGKRGAVSTSRLKRVILAKENRDADQVGFGVGLPSYMDRSEAKYWRAIEQGTSHFVGKRIYGLWGGHLTGNKGGRGQFGSYPIAGYPLSGFGHSSGGRLRPMGRKRAYKLLRSSYGMNSAKAKATIGLGWGEIKNPIQAHRYFGEAWEEFGTKRKAREALRDACAEVGISLRI